MAEINYDKLADEVARRLLRAPSPSLFINDTITDSDGARDVLLPLWQHPDSGRIELVQISLSQTSSAGVYRTDGPGVQNNVGQYLPAGGGVIYLATILEIRQFRIQATTAGGTIPLSATAYLSARGGR